MQQDACGHICFQPGIKVMFCILQAQLLSIWLSCPNNDDDDEEEKEEEEFFLMKSS